MFVPFTEVRGMLPPTEDSEVWVSALGVNVARAHTPELTELHMDNGEHLMVRGTLNEVVMALEQAQS